MSSPGVLSVASRHPFDETVGLVETAIGRSGLVCVASLALVGEEPGDRPGAATARADGACAPRSRLLLCSDPTLDARLVASAPTLGLDLPWRLLVSQGAGRVCVSCDSETWLAARHGVPESLLEELAEVGARVRSLLGCVR